MRTRCTNPRDKAYPRYGGKGIAVCPEWQTFAGFMSWEKFDEWRPGLQIDRIDNDRGYSPENCRWVTSQENSQNRSDNRFTPDGIRAVRMLSWSGLNNAQIAKIFGVRIDQIWRIVTRKIWNNI